MVGSLCSWYFFCISIVSLAWTKLSLSDDLEGASSQTENDAPRPTLKRLRRGPATKTYKFWQNLKICGKHHVLFPFTPHSLFPLCLVSVEFSLWLVVGAPTFAPAGVMLRLDVKTNVVMPEVFFQGTLLEEHCISITSLLLCNWSPVIVFVNKYSGEFALFVWLISHQPAVLFSQNKPATSNQPPVLFSQNKSAPAISHQPNEQTGSFVVSSCFFS
jgi:hypothetical protein